MSKAMEMANTLTEESQDNPDDYRWEAAAELRRLSDIEHEHRALLVNEQNLREELAALKQILSTEHTARLNCMEVRNDIGKELAAIKASLGEPVAWLVCSVNKDKTLSPEFAAAWRDAAHDHIKDAVEYKIEGASAWVVRPVYALTNKDQS